MCWLPIFDRSGANKRDHPRTSKLNSEGYCRCRRWIVINPTEIKSPLCGFCWPPLFRMNLHFLCLTLLHILEIVPFPKTDPFCMRTVNTKHIHTFRNLQNYEFMCTQRTHQVMNEYYTIHTMPYTCTLCTPYLSRSLPTLSLRSLLLYVYTIALRATTTALTNEQAASGGKNINTRS